MPLPKMPTKPAALLSPKDFPKADKDKRVKPAIALVEPLPQPPAVEADKSVRAKAPGKVAEVPSASARSARSAATPITSGTRRKSSKSDVKKLFVLDTNVLMHDPSSLFRFEEHDVYLPMMTLEELDNNKKGMSEVARNAR